MFDLLVSPFFDSQGGQIKVRFGGTLRVRPTLLQHRPEKAVGVRQIREHHQIVSEACSDPVRKVNPLLGQHIRSAKRFELGMAAQKISDNGLVFFFKKRARGIDKAESQKGLYIYKYI